MRKSILMKVSKGKFLMVERILKSRKKGGGTCKVFGGAGVITQRENISKGQTLWKQGVMIQESRKTFRTTRTTSSGQAVILNTQAGRILMANSNVCGKKNDLKPWQDVAALEKSFKDRASGKSLVEGEKNHKTSKEKKAVSQLRRRKRKDSKSTEREAQKNSPDSEWEKGERH